MDKQLLSQIEPARHRSLIICFISIIAGLIVHCHKPQQTDGTESDDEIASEGMIPKTNLLPRDFSPTRPYQNDRGG